MIKQDDHVIDFVDDYLHDVLDSRDAAYVEQHCEQCRICKVAMEEARRRVAACETVAPSEASGQLIQSTLTRIDTCERQRRPLDGKSKSSPPVQVVTSTRPSGC